VDKHTVRTKEQGYITLSLSRARAIKLMCTECMGWETNPKECTDPHCPLFLYRGRTTLTGLSAKPGEEIYTHANDKT